MACKTFEIDENGNKVRELTDAELKQRLLEDDALYQQLTAEVEAPKAVAETKVLRRPSTMPDGEDGIELYIKNEDGTEKSLGKFYPEDTKEMAKIERGYKLADQQKAKRTPQQKISEGLQDLAEALGAIKSATGGEAKDPVKALKVIAEGLIEQGIATADNVWQKINEFLSDKYSPEDLKKITRYQKEVVDYAKKYDTKSFIDTVKNSPQTTEEMAQKVGELEQYYNVLENKDAIANADKIIAKDFNAAKKLVLSDSAMSAEKSVLAIRLIKHYEALKDWDSAIEILDAYDKQLRRAGQFIQAASIWNKTSPEVVLRKANKMAEAAGLNLSPETKKGILEKLSRVNSMEEGEEKSKATFEVLDYIASQLPLSWTELFEAYRYQNMLSNPRTHLRNIYGNLFNTFVTAPTDMIAEGAYDYFRHPFNPIAREVKLSDARRYIKSVYNTVPMAVQAASEAFSKGYMTQKILDLPTQEASIEALRRTKMPKALTVVPRMLEAQDAFFSVLIGQGEKSRLMADGMTERDATKKGVELAEKYLYRERLGEAEKQANELSTVKALDALGRWALAGKNGDTAFSKSLGWFVPFITTPINMAKMGVRRSPIALADLGIGAVRGKQVSKEQIAQATLGTLITSMAGIMAAQGLTEWAAPQDEKEKKLFYASGRKPYSVKIGDKYVPMVYFGPYALAIGIAAALKYYMTEQKRALTDNEVEKVVGALSSIGGFLTSQTPLQGIDAMSNTLTNPDDFGLGKTLAFTAGQMIPLQGLIRYINTILDPVIRKPKDFVEAVEKDIPFLSKDIAPIQDIKGNPVNREFFNYFTPYDLGLSVEEYDLDIKERRKLIQEREANKKKPKYEIQERN